MALICSLSKNVSFPGTTAVECAQGRLMERESWRRLTHWCESVLGDFCLIVIIDRRRPVNHPQRTCRHSAKPRWQPSTISTLSARLPSAYFRIYLSSNGHHQVCTVVLDGCTLAFGTLCVTLYPSTVPNV